MSAGIADHRVTKDSPPRNSNTKTSALTRMMTAVTTERCRGRRDASPSGIRVPTLSSALAGAGGEPRSCISSQHRRRGRSTYSETLQLTSVASAKSNTSQKQRRATANREGINIVRAASAAGVGVSHLVYSSVAGADRATGIPHFDSKFEVEKAIRQSGVPFTIVAPVFFMENFLADWMAAGIAKGSIAMALPATRRLQQIAVADIAQFTALVIERRGSFLGQRIDIASDEVTSATVAAAISEASGRRIESTPLPLDAARQPKQQLRGTFERFDTSGHGRDVGGLRLLYPEVDWHRFSNWAREQDWSAI